MPKLRFKNGVSIKPEKSAKKGGKMAKELPKKNSPKHKNGDRDKSRTKRKQRSRFRKHRMIPDNYHLNSVITDVMMRNRIKDEEQLDNAKKSLFSLTRNAVESNDVRLLSEFISSNDAEKKYSKMLDQLKEAPPVESDANKPTNKTGSKNRGNLFRENKEQKPKNRNKRKRWNRRQRKIKSSFKERKLEKTEESEKIDLEPVDFSIIEQPLIVPKFLQNEE
ncbi:hypothetical protein MHBO_000344 [Bonamia ostreae]|uniref:Uncharacterized protein n=1 Tax=Bonamia ostreae TaxID=126728 RepID=A0ABV2AFC5_9EUKA